MAKYNIPNLYIANRDRASAGGGSDPELEQRVEALETSVDGDGGLSDQVETLDEQINGDSTATPPVPGIVDEIEALEIEVFGDSSSTPPVAGLDDRVTALENASGTTLTKLWENADPTQSFAAQDVENLTNLSTYDVIIVEGLAQADRESITSVMLNPSTKGILNYTLGSSTAGNGAVTYYRQFQIDYTNGSIHFNDAAYAFTGQAVSNLNSTCIPYKIYGIKF